MVKHWILTNILSEKSIFAILKVNWGLFILQTDVLQKHSGWFVLRHTTWKETKLSMQAFRNQNLVCQCPTTPSNNITAPVGWSSGNSCVTKDSSNLSNWWCRQWRCPHLPAAAAQARGDRQNRMEVVLVVVALQQHISTCCSCKP